MREKMKLSEITKLLVAVGAVLTAAGEVYKAYNDHQKMINNDESSTTRCATPEKGEDIV